MADRERCNLCGKPLDEWDVNENFGFEYYVGYGSKYDLDHVKARFCCDCFDKLLDELIDRCKINPVIGEYYPIEYDECSEDEFCDGQVTSQDNT